MTGNKLVIFIAVIYSLNLQIHNAQDGLQCESYQKRLPISEFVLFPLYMLYMLYFYEINFHFRTGLVFKTVSVLLSCSVFRNQCTYSFRFSYRNITDVFQHLQCCEADGWAPERASCL